jgi:uncharacterized protein YukE
MASLGNVFQFDFGKVAEAIGKFGEQKNKTDESQSIVKNFGPQVQAAWIGGDADEFVADIARKLMPKFTELALAFVGIQANLTKASDQSSGADKQAAGLANGFSDVCNQIYPG